MTADSDRGLSAEVLGGWPVSDAPAGFAERVMAAIDEDAAGGDAADGLDAGGIASWLGFARAAGAALLAAFAVTLAYELIAHREQLFYSYVFETDEIAFVGPWRMVTAILVVALSLLGAAGLAIRWQPLRWLSIGVSAQLAVGMLASMPGPGDYVAPSESLTSLIGASWLPLPLWMLGFTAVAGVAVQALRRDGVDTALLPLGLCLALFPAFLFPEGRWLFPEGTYRLLIVGGGAVVLFSAVGTHLATRLPRLAQLSYIGSFISALYLATLLPDRVSLGGLDLWNPVRQGLIALCGALPVLAFALRGRLGAVVAGMPRGRRDSSGRLHRTALVERKTPPKLLSVAGVSLGLGICAVAAAVAIGHDFRPDYAEFSDEYIRAARAGEMAVAMLLSVAFCLGVAVLGRSVRGAFGLPQPVLSRAWLYSRLVIVAASSLYLMGWVFLSGHLRFENPAASPSLAFGLSLVVWIICVAGVPRMLADAMFCLRSRLPPLSAPQVALTSDASGVVRVSGVIEPVDDDDDEPVYVDDLLRPEPAPTGKPFLLRGGSERLLVKLDASSRVVSDADSDGVVRLRAGADVTVVGELHTEPDPYRRGLGQMGGTRDEPLVVVSGDANTNRRLMLAAGVELIVGAALVAGGVLLVAVWLAL